MSRVGVEGTIIVRLNVPYGAPAPGKGVHLGRGGTILKGGYTSLLPRTGYSIYSHTSPVYWDASVPEGAVLEVAALGRWVVGRPPRASHGLTGSVLERRGTKTGCPQNRLGQNVLTCIYFIGDKRRGTFPGQQRGYVWVGGTCSRSPGGGTINGGVHLNGHRWYAQDRAHAVVRNFRLSKP